MNIISVYDRSGSTTTNGDFELWFIQHKVGSLELLPGNFFAYKGQTKYKFIPNPDQPGPNLATELPQFNTLLDTTVSFDTPLPYFKTFRSQPFPNNNRMKEYSTHDSPGLWYGIDTEAKIAPQIGIIDETFDTFKFTSQYRLQLAWVNKSRTQGISDIIFPVAHMEWQVTVDYANKQAGNANDTSLGSYNVSDQHKFPYVPTLANDGYITDPPIA